MEEEVRICDYCGRVLAEEEGTPVDDELLCDDCVEEHCVTCDHCGETIWEQNSVSDEDTCLCQDCFDAHYYRCESCGQIVPESIVCWHGDLPYCERCFDEFADEIEEYGYKPTPIFYGNGKRYFGVELEVDDGGKDNDNAASLKSIANIHEENIYIKSDGSLEDGFEIVSHPMTLDYHMESMNWKELLQEAVAMGYRSHQTSTCGLHVHVNRNAFGDNQAEQEDVISRILFFVEKHWNELFTFSRRSSYNMSRWSARFGFEKTGKQILEKAKSGCNGRYVAVNLNNYHTIEFRLFRGTLKYNTFIATLQMVNHICDAAISLSEEGIDAMSWSEFVSSIEEPELIQYLKERRLYVNEMIAESEEM